MTVTKEQIEAYAAAKAAIATEQAAVDAGWPSDEEPAISERARELLRRGGIEAVIDSGECPDCADALVARRMAVAGHNRRMDALAAAKVAVGYDAVRSVLSARTEQLAPKRVIRKGLSAEESQELTDLAALLGVDLIVPKKEE